MFSRAKQERDDILTTYLDQVRHAILLCRLQLYAKWCFLGFIDVISCLKLIISFLADASKGWWVGGGGGGRAQNGSRPPVCGNCPEREPRGLVSAVCIVSLHSCGVMAFSGLGSLSCIINTSYTRRVNFTYCTWLFFVTILIANWW